MNSWPQGVFIQVYEQQATEVFIQVFIQVFTLMSRTRVSISSGVSEGSPVVTRSCVSFAPAGASRSSAKTNVPPPALHRCRQK